MSSKYRRDPKVGTIVRVQIAPRRYAYLCLALPPTYWLYDFLTDSPVSKAAYFRTDRWLKPCTVQRFLKSAIDVCSIQLTEEDQKNIPLWKPLEPWEMDKERWPTPYCVYDPELGCHRPGTAEEIVGMHREIWLEGEEVVPWIMEQAHELELIHVPPADRDTRVIGLKDVPESEPEEDRLIEIVFPPNHPELAARLGEMEDEFSMELELADCGAVNGSGMMEGGGSFDVALDVNPRRLKTALRVIRKVLKRFKAPPETQILEHHSEYEDPIEHPLADKPGKS
jgi:hypothetical protein